ncbi:hypothetical protein JCM10207_005322 [Rhodosporidiobolus poonsookiae]
MDEGADGLSLPTFSGRLSGDWTAHEARLKSWLSIQGIPLHAREAAEALQLSLTAQAALSFEHEAGDAERRVWDEAVSWCREKWAGEERKKLAAAAALNRLHARSFRERGLRRENVKDLISDVELLSLQAGLDDITKHRAFVSCFFEFPHAFHRLSRTSTYEAATLEAMQWEAEMVQKEREDLTSHLRPVQPHQRPQRDPSAASAPFERPSNPTPGGGTTAPGLSPVMTRFAPRAPSPTPSTPNEDVTFRDDDLLDPTDALVGATAGQTGYTAARATRAALYPARSVETLHAYPSSTRTQHSHERRAHSSLAAYPSPDSIPPVGLPRPPPRPAINGARANPLNPACARTKHRSPLPSFSTPPRPAIADDALLAPGRASMSTPAGSLRALTPPFVAEATSYDSHAPDEGGDDAARLSALYDRFPHPHQGSYYAARPTSPSAASAMSAASSSGRASPFAMYATRPLSVSGAGGAGASALFGGRLAGLKLRGRGKPPPAASAGAAGRAGAGTAEAEMEGSGKGGKKGLLGALFGGGKKGHARNRSTAETRRTSVDEGAWVGAGAGRAATLGRVESGAGRAFSGLRRVATLDEAGGEGRPAKQRRAALAGVGLGLPP